jgi:hypothetical protein
LANLKKEQAETKTQLGNIKPPTNYWGIGTAVGISALLVIKIYEMINSKKVRDYE